MGKKEQTILNGDRPGLKGIQLVLCVFASQCTQLPWTPKTRIALSKFVSRTCSMQICHLFHGLFVIPAICNSLSKVVLSLHSVQPWFPPIPTLARTLAHLELPPIVSMLSAYTTN